MGCSYCLPTLLCSLRKVNRKVSVEAGLLWSRHHLREAAVMLSNGTEIQMKVVKRAEVR